MHGSQNLLLAVKILQFYNVAPYHCVPCRLES